MFNGLNNKPGLMKTSDGKIFEEPNWDEGVIHQKVLDFNGDERGATFSMDNGEHWDWEYGSVEDGKIVSVWHRTRNDERKTI